MNTYGSITLALLSLISIMLAPTAQAQVGALDVTFDGDGMRSDNLSRSDVTGDVAVQSDGDIIVFGRSENPDNLRSRNGRVTIYQPDGSMDDSWVHAPFSSVVAASPITSRRASSRRATPASTPMEKTRPIYLATGPTPR